MKKINFPPGALGAATLALTALLGFGCGTHTQRDMMVEAVNSGEKPVAMRGDGALFDGKLATFATVSRGFDRGSGAKGSKRGPGGANTDELDSGRRRKDSDGLTEVYSTGFGDSEEEQKEAMKEYYKGLNMSINGFSDRCETLQVKHGKVKFFVTAIWGMNPYIIINARSP